MDPNQQVPALQVVVGADGRLYVAIPQGTNVGTQVPAPPVMQVPIAAQVPDFLRMVQGGQPSVAGCPVPQQQQQATPGPANPLSAMVPFNPNLMNTAALMNPSVLAALAGLLQVPPMGDAMGGGSQSQPQGIQQMPVPAPSNDMGYSQTPSGEANSNAGNSSSASASQQQNNNNTSNSFVAAPQMSNHTPPVPMINPLTPVGGNPFPFFFDPSSNQLVQQMPYAIGAAMGQAGVQPGTEQLSVFQTNLAQPQMGQDGTAAGGVSNQQQQGAAAAQPSSRNQYEGVIPDRPPVLISMPFDAQSLSSYQCLVRQQIEIFQAMPADVEANAQGRNRPIVLGQVGIRCRHCAMLPPKQRKSGAVYFPSKLNGVYQTAQNMAAGHLCHKCVHVPEAVRQQLLFLKEKKSSAGAGRKYWSEGARVLGVYEAEGFGLRFKPRQNDVP